MKTESMEDEKYIPNHHPNNSKSKNVKVSSISLSYILHLSPHILHPSALQQFFSRANLTLNYLKEALTDKIVKPSPDLIKSSFHVLEIGSRGWQFLTQQANLASSDSMFRLK